MRSIKNVITCFPCLMVVLIVMNIIGATVAQETHERQRLLERQRRLENRMDKLKLEQDFLLFLKSVYALDSKYLLIKVKEKRGQLKYKEKILKDFRILSVSSLRAIKQGVVTVTRKSDAHTDRRMLMFGNSLIIQGKSGAAVRYGKTVVPRITLGKKDLISVVNAMGAGSKAYIIP